MECMKFLGAILQTRNVNLVVLIMCFAFLLISSLNPSQFTAQGRQFPDANLIKGEEFAVKMGGLIGSRPPRCDGRCRNCGRCEAVQVPIAGSINKLLQTQIRRIEYSRGDDISNYKPMCWKCKCGDVFFNP